MCAAQNSILKTLSNNFIEVRYQYETIGLGNKIVITTTPSTFPGPFSPPMSHNMCFGNNTISGEIDRLTVKDYKPFEDNLRLHIGPLEIVMGHDVDDLERRYCTIITSVWLSGFEIEYPDNYTINRCKWAAEEFRNIPYLTADEMIIKDIIT